MRAALALALALAAAPAGAEPVAPEAFRDWAEGYTLHFERNGEPFGAERFEEGGGVLWQYRDGSCARGAWQPHDGRACFFYGPGTEVLCWSLRREAGALVARLEDGPEAGMELRVIRRDRARLFCGGGPAL